MKYSHRCCSEHEKRFNFTSIQCRIFYIVMFVRKGGFQAIPIFFCRSSEMPFVSGYSHRTTKNCSAIISEKKTNGDPPEEAAIKVKIPEIKAFMTQCAELPKLWPLALMRFGKTSLMYTQIKAPCEKANEAI